MKDGPFKKVGQALAKIGLPVLGTTVGGPAGGAIAAALGNLLGVGADSDAIEKALANASPEVIAKIKEFEAQVAVSENQRVSETWTSDNSSGYWLPANTRPLVVLSLLLFYYLWTTISTGAVFYFYAKHGKVDDAITGFLMAIGLQIVGFLTTAVLGYFGARSYDKRIERIH
jgi:hypothetical protein